MQKNTVKTVSDIRKSFIEYFQTKNHLIESSSALLPASDNTLLFTTAGMVPFKDYFSGLRKPPHTRIASVQKCMRTTDLEEVGKTRRHLSFFEMLGNFSFGDYFKKEAIEFAWEYSTEFLPFKKEDIWISIYKDDDEAFKIWNENIGVDSKKIVRLGEKDNFWGPAGETGACGPCSELYIDRGKEYGCESENCAPGCDCDRFIEFWNLVFNQYFKNAKKEFEPLPKTGIDTGAGLERMAALIQNVDSVYETDEISRIIDKVSEIYDKPYTGENIIPFRIIADHLRALVFAVSDGIYPSNESRGYVLRRVIRRALLHAANIGQKTPTMHRLVDTIVEIYSEFYPNLLEASPLARKYIQSEEERFLKTLDEGVNRLREIMNISQNTIKGKDAFLLYDTYGFPLEMTAEIAEKKGFTVDYQAFENEMEKQREKGRSAWKGGALNINISELEETKFTGYKKNEDESKIISLFLDNDRAQKIEENKIKENQLISFVVQNTPFYAESGGQTGDTGYAETESAKLKIIDAQKAGNYFIHVASNLEGEIKEGDKIKLVIDEVSRNEIKKNHSATHLLNAALRSKLGAHIKQSGSFVHKDYLRFDFNHPEALSENEVTDIEISVNREIDKNLKIITEELPIDEAQKKGAIMTFGEKYGSVVRVVEMGDFSKEFCGGTHVKNTSEIMLFLITKESSPGAGNRRIEALTGNKAFDFISKEEKKINIQLKELLSLEKINGFLNIRKEAELIENELKSLNEKEKNAVEFIARWQIVKKNSKKISELTSELKKIQKKEKNKTSLEVDNGAVLDLLSKKESKENIFILKTVLSDYGIPHLQKICDLIRERENKLLIILASVKNNHWSIVCAATKEYAKELSIHLGDKLKKALASVDELTGGGGGKNELAQGSGTFNGENKEDSINILMQQIENSILEEIKK
ncbi:MAG: alanine--tRNA ligase [Spirochaetia bacterium]|nr:alanine--tRNA ligase [Spirochaetia bacterium]